MAANLITMDKPKRILIFNHRHMGDVLMTTPALRALHHHFQNAWIDCVTSKVGKELLRGQMVVNRVLLEEDFEHLSKKGWYDVAILFKATLRNSLRAIRLGIPKRIGYRREWNQFLLTHSINIGTTHHHPLKKNIFFFFFLFKYIN